jgi:DNA-binding NtrC family response regulator
MSTFSYYPASFPPARCKEPKHVAPEIPPASGMGEFEMVGESAAMNQLQLQVRRIGPHFRTVLVSGELGTGKELAARALHRASPVADGPFVVYAPSTVARGEGMSNDCVAAGDQLDHSLKMAHRGTLFVDGIGKMPLEAQARLLQVLDRHEKAQEGLAALQKRDIRVIASSSEDLRMLASAGRFLQDLYHRIAMVEISLQPLRDRQEDIPALAMHFVRKFARLYGKRVSGIMEEAMDRLREHDWPENVSEMEDVMRNGVALGDGEVVEAGHLELPRAMRVDAAVTTSEVETARLQDVIERHVLHVLKSCAGNKLRAAEVLGISRSTLYRMLDACFAAE